MTLPRAARYLLTAIVGFGFFTVVEFYDSLGTTAIGAIVLAVIVSAAVLVYFVGKEMSPLHNVTAVLLVCFFVLFVQLNRVQVLQAEATQSVPGNNRQLQRDFGSDRGQILSNDGQVVAFSEPVESENFGFRRIYPHGELYAHSVGYVSLTLGSEGLEARYNSQLTGDQDLVLGINHELQQVAREALKDPETGADRPGSIVAIEPATGEIRALWSYPSYDPQPLASLSSTEISEAIELLEPSGNAESYSCLETPRCPKAYGDRTVPGSTFKIIVAAAGLDSTPLELNQPRFPDVEEYKLPDGDATLGNYGGSNCGGPLVELIRRSCNAGFAQMAVEVIGPEGMVNKAEKFGFNQKIPLDVPESDVVASNYPTDYGNFRGNSNGESFNLYDESNKLGLTAIGQSDVQASPLNMAMVAAAVANDGVMMQPRLVSGFRDSSSEANQYDRIRANEWLSSTTGRTAADLQEAMYQVVQSGTATGLQTSGLDVGAKTGTADIGDDVHAWVIAFAGPANAEPELALAVLVERQAGEAGVTGGRVAAPIAKQIFEKYYNLDAG